MNEEKFPVLTEEIRRAANQLCLDSDGAACWVCPLYQECWGEDPFDKLVEGEEK